MTGDEQVLMASQNTPQGSGFDDRFNLLLLAFIYGAYFLLGTILGYISGGITEHDEFSIFVQGWITAPLLTILAVSLIYKVKQTKFQKDAVFLPMLLGINVFLGLLAITALHFIGQSANSSLALTRSITAIFILFPVLQIIILWGLDRFRASRILSQLNSFESTFYWLILPGIGAMLVMFSGIYVADTDYSLSPKTLLLAIPFGFLAYLHQYLITPATKKVVLALDVLAIILIIGACFDPYFEISAVHQNFFLGPVNALLHGKTMLVDVYSQYGVFLQEFLAFCFKLRLIPLNYQGLALLVALLSMFQYGLVYFLARTLIKSPRFSLLLLFIILLVNLFATKAYFQSVPSIGPVRFGLCYILIVFTALRLKYPAKKSVFLGLEYGTLGLASIWSFETFIYTSAIFYGLRGYDTLATTNTIRGFKKKIVPELLKSIFAIVLFHSVQALTIFFATGTWPHWTYYFEFIYLYSLAGAGGLPIDAWSPWFIIIAIYFIGLMYPFITRVTAQKWDLSIETQIIVGLVFFGTAQFTYYVGRSSPEALFHVCVPAALIAGYGASQITKSAQLKYKSARNISIFMVYAAIALLGIIYLPSLVKKAPHTGFGFAYSLLEEWHAHGSGASIFRESYDRLWHPKPTTPQAAEAIELIKKYAANKTRIMIFLSSKNFSQATTEVLFLSNKAHLYPVTDQLQDSLSFQVSNFIVNYAPNLQVGDVIFLPTQPKELTLRPYIAAGFQFVDEFQKKIVLKLCNQFSLSVLESTPSGITAFRLEAPGNRASNYCSKTRALKSQ
jgi:hypothetical protein